VTTSTASLTTLEIVGDEDEDDELGADDVLPELDDL
jgi:hypothetical protein